MIRAMDTPTREPLVVSESVRPGTAARAEPSGARAGLRLPPLILAMRPRQWLKNGLVFLALIFSVNESWQPGDLSSWAPLLARSVLAFIAFTAVASAEYLINDMRDIESDRLHPRKRRRPLASGALDVRTA